MQSSSVLLLVAMGAIAVGLGLAGVGVILLVKLGSFTRSARRVSGRLLGYNTVRSSDGDDLYAPTVAYTDEAGREHQVTFTVATSFRQHQPGDAVTLLVNPSDPTDVKIAGGIGHWLFPAIVTVVGLFFAFVGVLMAVLPLVF
jgi:hypothetical protein